MKKNILENAGHGSLGHRIFCILRDKILNEEYEKRIQEVKEQELDKKEERKLIKEIRNEMQGDQEYNKLKNTVQEFQRTTFEKLDKYSEYKYKG